MARHPFATLAATLAASLAVTAAACTDDPMSAAAPRPALALSPADSMRITPIADLVVAPDTARVVVGRTTRLAAVLRDSVGAELTERAIAWSSSADSIARVDSTGEVTGLMLGAATITASVEGRTATALVTVHDALVYTVAIAPRPVAVVVGDTVTLGAAARDAQGADVEGAIVRWASATPKVATVDSASGLVTAHAAGEALVTATSGARSDTMTVAVAPGIAGIRIVPAVDTLEAYERRQLHVRWVDSAGRVITHGPAIAGRTVRWSSADTAIATVDSVTGALTGVDRGTARIIARSGDLVDTAQRVVVIRYRSITSGSDHACNLASGGIAWCWGRNGRQGMIGLDRLDDKEISSVPVRIRGGHRFVQLTTFGSTTCGLTAEGKAWCWGYNGWGALGIGKSSPAQSPIPMEVAGGIRFKSLASGETQTCGISLADKVYCWGYGQYYQFGNGNGRGSDAPILSASDSTLVAVSMGGDAGCGLDRRGAAMCWGWNGAGQDGGGQRPSNGNTYTKVPTPVVGGLTFRSLSLSESYACGVTPNDRAYCWGASGMVGSAVPNNVSTPTPIAGDLEVRTISAGKSHACVLTTDDDIYCWGANRQGQLGAGPANGSRLPIRAAGELKASEISAANLAIGYAAFTCAISTDRLTTYCWGRGDFGQLGNGTTVNEDVVNNTPTIVRGQEPAKE